jgi:hypothetical protein
MEGVYVFKIYPSDTNFVLKRLVKGEIEKVKRI